MNIILDIFALAVFIFSIYRGYKKGFVKTVLKLCSGIVCLILAISLSPTVGQFLNDNYISPALEGVITDKISELTASADTSQTDIDKIIEEEPNEFIQILEKFNVDFETFKEKFNQFSSSSVENASQATIEYVAKPLSETVSYIVSFILILLVSSLVLAVVTFLLDKIVKLPILKTANKFLGMVAGILFGLLWVYVLAMVMEISLPYIRNVSAPAIAQIEPSSTMFFKYFYTYNPVFETIKALF